MFRVPGEPKAEVLPSKDTLRGVGVYFGREKQIKSKTRINVQGSGMWASAFLVAPWPATLA